jgi:N-acetyl-anhydromuramyl-L-alanine amidase AmpD
MMAINIDQWDACRNYYPGGPVKLGIVPHHKVGGSGSPAGMWNANGNVSAHYSIDTDGKKWGHVGVTDRAWHTGDSYGNTYLIGIECSNTSIAPPYPVSDATIEALKEMMCDIARAYGWKQLNWHGDKNAPGYVCGHRDLGATACPGDYLYSRLPGIVADVNRML